MLLKQRDKREKEYHHTGRILDEPTIRVHQRTIQTKSFGLNDVIMQYLNHNRPFQLLSRLHYSLCSFHIIYIEIVNRRLKTSDKRLLTNIKSSNRLLPSSHFFQSLEKFTLFQRFMIISHSITVKGLRFLIFYSKLICNTA